MLVVFSTLARYPITAVFGSLPVWLQGDDPRDRVETLSAKKRGPKRPKENAEFRWWFPGKLEPYMNLVNGSVYPRRGKIKSWDTWLDSNISQGQEKRKMNRIGWPGGSPTNLEKQSSLEISKFIWRNKIVFSVIFFLFSANKKNYSRQCSTLGYLTLSFQPPPPPELSSTNSRLNRRPVM